MNTKSLKIGNLEILMLGTADFDYSARQWFYKSKYCMRIFRFVFNW